MAKRPSQRRSTGRAKPRNLFPRLLADIRQRTRGAAFRSYVKNLLLELCCIDTTPKSEPSQMQAAEGRCFHILERELGKMKFSGARLERRPIEPAIQQHPSFSQLHFTKTARRPQGLSAEHTYQGRCNLLYFVPAQSPELERSRSGTSLALNAHIDVVPPYFPPAAKAGTVYGRGSCDDKGPVVSIIAALRVLSELMAARNAQWNKNLTAMFVVEEETGGNGSLSLALDRNLKRLYDSILVCECTGLKIHPANRGAVWYRAELKQRKGIELLELFAFVNEELEKEGAAIRAESRHPLFPQRPVQTCHGVIGQFGEHPSRICGEVSFVIQLPGHLNKATAALLEDCLQAGLQSYVGLYGDKTKVEEPGTGKPMVRRHYVSHSQPQTKQLMVTVFGATGHMGSIRERDGAITKMAHLIRSLVRSRTRLEKAAGGKIRLTLAGQDSGAARRPESETNRAKTLVLEGGQGFVPTHGIEEIMKRIRAAAHRGADNYLRLLGLTAKGADLVTVTYEKLHNAAFDGDPNSPTMRNALAAAEDCGLWKGEPVLGWTVSCDARLFATEYPGLPVLTFGPGQLAWAHSDREQIEVAEICRAAEFLALFMLRQTCTANERDSGVHS